jgi:PAS domain S-box-containing protein
MRDARGRITGGVGLVEDVTERVTAGNSLRESEENYRQLVDNANEAIFVAQDGVFAFANPKVVELSGYSREELTMKPFSSLIHPDDRDTLLDRHRRRMNGEAVQPSYPFRMVTRDGSVRWVYIHVVTVSWEGRPAAMGFLLDITESVSARAELQETESRYRLLAENAGDIIFTMDEHVRFTYISPSVTRMRGWTVEEAMAQSPADALTPASYELAMKTLADALDRGMRGEHAMPGEVTLELEETCKDGSTVWTAGSSRVSWASPGTSRSAGRPRRP